MIFSKCFHISDTDIWELKTSLYQRQISIKQKMLNSSLQNVKELKSSNPNNTNLVDLQITLLWAC